MAVYGDMLAYFPELKRRAIISKAVFNTNGTIKKRDTIMRVSAVFQYMKRGVLENEAGILSEDNVPTLWTSAKLTAGWFVELEKDESIYRIVKVSKWGYEGKFNVYELSEFNGSSDYNKPDDKRLPTTRPEIWQ